MPKGPRFGMVLGIAPLNELVRKAKSAEKGNFDLVCYYDHTLFWSMGEENAFELWSILTTLANETSQIKISPLVTDCLRRHPSITAQTVLTLDQISNGRAILAIGSGSPINLDPYGISWEKPVSKLREAIQVIKSLWLATEENPISFNGKFFSLENAFLQVRSIQQPHPPLYQSAFGPSSRQLAGELATGFLTAIETPQMLQESLKDVQSGTKKAGRSLEDLTVLLDVSCAVSMDSEAARKTVEIPLLADITSQPFQRKRLGIKDDTPEFKLLDEFRKRGMKGISHDKLMKTVRNAANQISPNIIDDLAVFGTPDDCIGQIEKFAQAGVDIFLIENYGPDILEVERFFAEKIIPYFSDESED
ncbi:MAG: LLM class flavin-dependent oxidoreductase [Promethearchaeota archaeon]